MMCVVCDVIAECAMWNIFDTFYFAMCDDDIRVICDDVICVMYDYPFP